MKLKIVHQNQENRGCEEQVRKKESEEIDQVEENQSYPLPEEESTRENSPSRDLFPSPHPVHYPVILYGKRKRKPKELIDEISIFVSRKKKKPSTNKLKYQGTPNWMETSKSKGIGTACGSLLKSPTTLRAEEVQLSLGDKQPSFLKVLVRSHVASCFWMGLPVPFCKLHLPVNDTIVILENESGEAFGIKYIARKTGLSAGWRKFVSGNMLLEGDVLIFHLIGACRFKVYVIRENELTEVDGALSLLNLDSQTKQTEPTIDAQNKTMSRSKSLSFTSVQRKKQKDENSGNDSEEVASEVLECSKFVGSTFHFKDVKSFEDFHIVVNGVCIDSELSEYIRRKYYKLCCSKNGYLHNHLLPGLSSKLAAGMIFEVVSTADAIRSCNLSTPREEFDVWEKSLRSFELLGLKVGFIRARLHCLVNLSFNSEDAAETRRFCETRDEHNHIEEEVHNLEVKLVELKELSAKHRQEMDSLKMKAENYELMFHEEANAPW